MIQIARKTNLDQIDLVECLIASGLLDVKNADDILVVEVAQELHLAEGSQAEHGVVERRDLLDRDLLPRGLMYGRAGKKILSAIVALWQLGGLRTHQTTP